MFKSLHIQLQHIRGYFGVCVVTVGIYFFQKKLISEIRGIGDILIYLTKFNLHNLKENKKHLFIDNLMQYYKLYFSLKYESASVLILNVR